MLVTGNATNRALARKLRHVPLLKSQLRPWGGRFSKIPSVNSGLPQVIHNDKSHVIFLQAARRSCGPASDFTEHLISKFCCGKKRMGIKKLPAT